MSDCNGKSKWCSSSKINEGVVALELLFELWDISGDIFAFVTMKDSGNTDLFIAFAVCLVPPVVFSAGSVAQRRAHRADPLMQRAGWTSGCSATSSCCVAARQRHEEHKNANDAACYKAYSRVHSARPY